MLAEDFIGIYGAATLSKRQMLDGLKARRIKDVTWDDLRIRVKENTAVVTAISTIATGTGKDAKIDIGTPTSTPAATGGGGRSHRTL